jgi:hypothetical protein
MLKTDLEKDRVAYGDPQVLPAGKGVMFTLTSSHAVTQTDLDISVLSPGSSEPRILIHGGSHARYVPTGQIVYARDGALLSVGFDLSKLEVTGTPVTVMNGLEKNWSGSDYSVSDTGTLAYAPDMGPQNLLIFASVDLKGNVQPLMSPQANTSEFSISPNGRYIAARLFGVANDDIWVYDVTVGTPQRVTFEPLDDIFPDVSESPKAKSCKWALMRLTYSTIHSLIFRWALERISIHRTSGESPIIPNRVIVLTGRVTF